MSDLTYCDWFQSRLSDLLDWEAPGGEPAGAEDIGEAARLRAHAAGCPRCRGLLESTRQSLQMLRLSDSEITLPGFVSQRLHEELSRAMAADRGWSRQKAMDSPARSESGKTGRRWIYWGWRPALASMALLFVLAGGVWLRMRSQAVILQGWLVDGHCAPRLIAMRVSGGAHQRDCLLRPACRKAGYGILRHGHWVRFDARGNSKAVRVITRSRRRDHLLVRVRGDRRGNTIQVASLSLLPVAEAVSYDAGNSSGDPAAAQTHGAR